MKSTEYYYIVRKEHGKTVQLLISAAKWNRLSDPSSILVVNGPLDAAWCEKFVGRYPKVKVVE